jgi:microcystin-dependent protein
MPSTYTSNGGIEKIGLGEKAGAWGTTTNNNFDIIDKLTNGVVSITLSGTTHTLTTSDGSVSDGMSKVLVLGGSPSGTNTITISPNDADKLYFVQNGTSQIATFTQGSGANVSVAAGKQAIIFADGAGSGAAVTEIKPTAADASVVTATLADDAVTNAKIADDAVNADSVADNSIGAAAINIDGNGTSGQAVVSDGDGSFSYQSNIVPSGALMPYAGASAPTGFLLCDGSAVSRSTYATLFAALDNGNIYGAGDGSSTFNLPDLRGRVIAGQDDMGGASANRLTDQTGGLNGDTLGDTGGSETHTLTTAQLASHTHTFSDTDSHTVSFPRTFISGAANNSVNVDGSGERHDGGTLTVSISGTTSSTGSGSAHNNVQPTIILNYIIKT